MSQNKSDTDTATLTACYTCGILLSTDKFVLHVCQCPCISSKRSRQNPDVDNDTTSTVADGNVLLSDEENDDVSLSLDLGRSVGIWWSIW